METLFSICLDLEDTLYVSHIHWIIMESLDYIYIEHWNNHRRVLCYTAVLPLVLMTLFLSPPSSQTTGPQSSERASKACGGQHRLAEHGRRGRWWWGRSQNWHTSTPPRWERPLVLLHTETSRGTHRRLHLVILNVAERRSSIHRRHTTPGVQHHQLRGCPF